MTNGPLPIGHNFNIFISFLRSAEAPYIYRLNPKEINMFVKLIAVLVAGILFIHKPGENDGAQAPLSLQGTWRLISGTAITKGDTVVTDYTKGQQMIKIINKTHFAFMRHDLTNGKEANPVFEAGGGRYSLSGNHYTEHLDYCNLREWEGKSFQFTVAIKNDTLVQQGLEKVDEAGVNRIIIEKYLKVKN
jgi:hypothetical protein